MKSIKVYAADEIIADIKLAAQKLGTSSSRYLISLHVMRQENKYPGAVRGSRVALEVVPGWSGGISKAKQVGKKG